MRAFHAFVLLCVIVAATAAAARFVPLPQAAQAALVQSVKDRPRDTQQKPIFDVRQAPVPLLWAYKHQAVAVPEEQALTADTVVIPATPGEDPSQMANQSSDQTQAPADDPTKMGQAGAKAAIEADGYKGVTDLTQSPDGGWTARALRGATMVNLTVAADGSVSAN